MSVKSKIKKPLYIYATNKATGSDVKFVVSTHADLANALGISLPNGDLDVLGICQDNGYDVMAIIDDNNTVLYKHFVPKVEVYDQPVSKPSSEIIDKREENVTIIDNGVVVSRKNVKELIDEKQSGDIKKRVMDITVSDRKELGTAPREANEQVYQYKSRQKKSKLPVLALCSVLVIGIGGYGLSSTMFKKDISHSTVASVSSEHKTDTKAALAVKKPSFPNALVPKDDKVTATPSDVAPHDIAPHDITPAEVKQKDEELKKKLNIQTSDTVPFWNNSGSADLFKKNNWVPPSSSVSK